MITLALARCSVFCNWAFCTDGTVEGHTCARHFSKCESVVLFNAKNMVPNYTDKLFLSCFQPDHDGSNHFYTWFMSCATQSLSGSIIRHCHEDAFVTRMFCESVHDILFDSSRFESLKCERVLIRYWRASKVGILEQGVFFSSGAWSKSCIRATLQLSQ